MIDRTKPLCDFTEFEQRQLYESLLGMLKEADEFTAEASELRKFVDNKLLEILFPQLEA